MSPKKENPSKLNFDKIAINLTCIIIAIFTIIFFVTKEYVHAHEFNITPSVAPLYRILATIFLLIFFIFACRLLESAATHRLKTSWWDFGEKEQDEELDWPMTFRLASLEHEFDPVIMKKNEVWRRKTRYDIAIYLLICLGLGVSIAIALDYILFPHMPELLTKEEKGIFAHATTNLTAYLALLAATASIYFTYRQLRAKVRADSRQQWINTVRGLMAEIIAEIIDKSNGEKYDLKNLNQKRLHLELLLNPSEKDHRLLTMLIRCFAVPSAKIEGDREVIEDIEESLKNEMMPKDKYRIFLMIDEKNIRPSEIDYAISYIVKLSHVVLKREWERVRHIR